MNKVILTGRATQAPVVTDGSTLIARYGLAVDRRFKREGQPTVDFLNIVAFGKQAEFAQKYITKGMKIGVSGRIQTGSYKAQDGSTRYKTDIIVDEHEFLQSKAESASEGVTEETRKSAPQSVTEEHAAEWQTATEEELPFQ